MPKMGAPVKAKAVPHVHAHTGRRSQAAEKARICNVLQEVGTRRGETNTVARHGHKPGANDKLLIYKIMGCRGRPTQPYTNRGSQAARKLREHAETAFSVL
jgi:hypothetical protein